MSKQNCELTHLPNPSDQTQEPADLMSVTVNDGSPPPKLENGGSVGKPTIFKFEVEKPIFNWLDRLQIGKSSFTIDNSGSSMFAIRFIKIRLEFEEIKWDIVEIQLDLFEICRNSGKFSVFWQNLA